MTGCGSAHRSSGRERTAAPLVRASGPGLPRVSGVSSRMKFLASSLTLAILIGAATRNSAAETPEAAAQAAALAWVQLIDAGNYANSWETAARSFKSSMTQAQWISRVTPVRDPLGSVKSRNFVSARFTRTLPGAPDGEYVVIRFTTSFEHMASATETVTPVKEADGQWRVGGYFIK